MKILCSNLQRKSQDKDDGRGGRRYLPLVFTEQGVAMLSGVLKRERAAVVNIEIMRAFEGSVRCDSRVNYDS